LQPKIAKKIVKNSKKILTKFN